MDTNELAPGEAIQTQSQPAEPEPVMTTETGVVPVGSKVGHLLPASIPGRNGGTLIPITSATARDLARRRWDKAENVARRVLKEKSGGSNYLAGHAAIVEAQYDIAVSGSKGSTPAAVFVERAAGLTRERTATAAEAGQVVNVNNFIGEVSVSLIRNAALLLSDSTE